MQLAFRLVCSEGASFLTKEERDMIVRDAVVRAKRLPSEDAAIFGDMRNGLKVVVRFAKREVWIMTDDEAQAGHLPSPSDN